MKNINELLKQVKREVAIAENHLNFADADFVDVAILELTTAKKKLDIVIKLAKQHEES